MEDLIKGIIKYREEFKEEGSEAGIHYAMGWLNVEVKEGIKNYTSSDVLRLLKVINNDSDFTHEKEPMETTFKYRSMLERLQFLENTTNIGGAIYKFCPICGSANIQGHKKDCELAKLLK